MKCSAVRSLVLMVVVIFATISAAHAQYTVNVLSGTPAGYASNESNYDTPLLQASDGNFYGFEDSSNSSAGSLFQARTDGTITTIFNFPDATSGANSPTGNLVQAPDGFLYGATAGGGAYNAGVIFKVALDGTDFTDVYDIPNSSRTAGNVSGGLTLGSDGNLYGIMNGISLSYGDVARPAPGSFKADTGTRADQTTADRMPPVHRPGRAPSQPQPEAPSPTCSGSYEGVFFQYNVTTGTVTPLNCSVPLGGVAGTLLQAANGKFYGVDGPYGQVLDIVELDASGNETDYDVSARQNYIDSSLVAGPGNLLYWIGYVAIVNNFFLVSADPNNSFATAEEANLTGTCTAYGFNNGTMYYAGDGNLYMAYNYNNVDGGSGIIAYNGSSANCAADFGTNYSVPSSAPIQGGDGNFYGIAEYTSDSSGSPVYYQMTEPSPIPAPVQLVGPRGNQAAFGHAFDLQWGVTSAGSFAPPVCEAFLANAPGSGPWSGVLTGTGSPAVGEWGGTVSITPPAIGNYDYEVECPGVGSASLPIAVKYGTTSVVSASSTTVTVGQPVTLTATVSTSTGPTAPTGTVTFQSVGGPLGTATLTASGATTSTANVTVTSAGLPAGAYTVQAQYSGDTNNAANLSPVEVVTVQLQPTTTTVSSSLTTVAIGQSVVLTATVGGASPSGTVTFYAGSNAIGTAPISSGGFYSSQAALTVQTSTLPAGSFAVTAQYNGDSNNAASTSTNATNITITGFSTTTTLSATSLSVLKGNSVTVVANVSNTFTTPPSGSVTFYAGPAVLGSSTLNPATASTSTASLAIDTSLIAGGTYPVTARYTGDSQNAPSTAAAFNLTVTLQTYTLAINYFQDTEDSDNPQGTVSDFSAANVNVTLTGSGTPTGTVTVRCAGGVIGTYNVSPVTGGGFVYFHINQVVTAAGTCPMVATYNGDSTHGVSSSPPYTVTILPAPVTLQVQAATVVQQGQGLSFETVVITSGVGVWLPTGSVTFLVNGNVPLCSGTIDPSSLIASCSITVPTVANIRSYNVTAYYPGDVAHAAATSAPLTIAVNPAQ